MSEWRRETGADLDDAGRRIESALKGIEGEPTEAQMKSIWMAYLEVEKSVAFIKFDLEEENPGRFIRLRSYAVPDERQALQFALKNLKKGADNFSLGDFRQALKDLRESRNYLRALLREKRLKRARRARTG
ncbi:MAG: hypothetical protein JRN06_06980 [Nitrososphaerota archaeon]|nr:hypothetical protein [Nitrososphaerota archaeon]MDG7024476.1 hypothetical protein [Nitrososphaerota archaeon]